MSGNARMVRMVPVIDAVDNKKKKRHRREVVVHPGDRVVKSRGRMVVVSEGGGFASGEEAAIFLGVTRQAISQMVRAGTIPFERFGRALRIPWHWLLARERRAQETAVQETSGVPESADDDSNVRRQGASASIRSRRSRPIT